MSDSGSREKALVGLVFGGIIATAFMWIFNPIIALQYAQDMEQMQAANVSPAVTNLFWLIWFLADYQLDILGLWFFICLTLYSALRD